MNNLYYRIASVGSAAVAGVAAIGTGSVEYLKVGFIFAILFAICDAIQHA